MEPRRIYACSVIGCYNVHSSRHVIPIHNPQIKDIWLQRINNPALSMLTDEELHKKFICSAHFHNVCKGRRKLLPRALPTIGLSGFNKEATIENSFFNEDLEVNRPEISESFNIATTSGIQQGFDDAPCMREEQVNIPMRKRKIVHISALSPGMKLLCTRLKKYRSQCYTLKHQMKTLKKRVCLAEKLVREPTFQSLDQSVNSTVREFLITQLRQSSKAARGRRFSNNDKILALSLYKCSPKGYRLLQRIFTLPSYRTLSRVLARVPFVPGINKRIFKHLETVVRKLKPEEKYCNIIFDEVALQTGLRFNKAVDYIEGFVNYGDEKACKFADHALVFMLQGVHKKWKQPVAFMFCEGTTPAQQLATLIKRVTMEVIKCGLTPIATICDQGSTNQAAINILLREAKLEKESTFGFIVEDKEVIPLYDYPHLLKGIRNNLLTKDLIFTQDGVTRKASWSHIQHLYEWDKPTRYFNIFTKLTDAHIVPQKINKMRVKNCTQVFSNSVGMFMLCLIDAGSSVLTNEAEGTAKAFLFFDKLFDSFNGASKHAPEGHELRCVVTSGSPHHTFWDQAKAVLRTMKFLCPITKQRTVPPSLKNWIWTINGMQQIWRKLEGSGCKHLVPRNFNQDGLENFFGCIRSHGARNINPTCSSFIASFKALTLNNFTAPTSISSNCEDDLSSGILDNLKAFI